MPDNNDQNVQPPTSGIQPSTADSTQQSIPTPEQQAPQSNLTAALQPNVQPATSDSSQQIPQNQAPQPPADPLANHPAVQKASLLHRIAEATAGGPRIKTTYDPTTGEATREKVPLTSSQLLTGILANVLGGVGQVGTNLSRRMAGQAPLAPQPLPTQVAAQERAAQTDQDFERQQQTKVRQAKILNANLENQRLSYALRHQANDVLDQNIALHKDELTNWQKAGDVESSQILSSQILKKGFDPSKYLAIPDGHVPVYGADGQQVTDKNGMPVEELTYSVVRGDTQQPLTQDMYQKFVDNGLMKSQKPLSDQTEFKLPENATITGATLGLMNYKLGLIQQTQREIDSVVGPGKVNLSSEIKKNPGVLSALEKFHNSVSDDPITQLQDVTAKHPDAGGIMKNLFGGDAGLQAYAAKNQVAPDSLDENKARQILADPRTNPDSPAAKTATAFLSGKRTDKAQEEKDKLQAARTMEDSDLRTAAKNIVAGNVAQIKDLASFRGDQKARLYNMITDAAKGAGKDPKDYSPAKLEAKTKVLNDFADGKAADNIMAFNTFLQHGSEALDATGAMRAQAGSPLINRPLNWLRKNAANDANFAAFQTALVPVRKEYMNFLNNNRAEHEGDLKVMDNVLSDDSTPAQIEASLKQLGESADARLRELGRKYSNTMGDEYPNLIAPEGQAALQKMGVKSSLTNPQTPAPSGVKATPQNGQPSSSGQPGNFFSKFGGKAD